MAKKRAEHACCNILLCRLQCVLQRRLRGRWPRSRTHSFTCATLLIHMCAKTNSYLRHVSFTTDGDETGNEAIKHATRNLSHTHARTRTHPHPHPHPPFSRRRSKWTRHRLLLPPTPTPSARFTPLVTSSSILLTDTRQRLTAASACEMSGVCRSACVCASSRRVSVVRMGML